MAFILLANKCDQRRTLANSHYTIAYQSSAYLWSVIFTVIWTVISSAEPHAKIRSDNFKDQRIFGSFDAWSFNEVIWALNQSNIYCIIIACITVILVDIKLGAGVELSEDGLWVFKETSGKLSGGGTGRSGRNAACRPHPVSCPLAL